MDFRTERHRASEYDDAMRPKMAINSDTEEDDSDEDDDLRAAKKAIYARNYLKKSMAEERVLEEEDSMASESDY